MGSFLLWNNIENSLMQALARAPHLILGSPLPSTPSLGPDAEEADSINALQGSSAHWTIATSWQGVGFTGLVFRVYRL